MGVGVRISDFGCLSCIDIYKTKYAIPAKAMFDKRAVNASAPFILSICNKQGDLLCDAYATEENWQDANLLMDYLKARA